MAGNTLKANERLWDVKTQDGLKNLTYSTKVGKSDLDFNARWVHELENRNRPGGDLLQFSASLKF
jgi:hypothetical protein